MSKVNASFAAALAGAILITAAPALAAQCNHKGGFKAFIAEVGRKYGLTISNIFHAGDGNMHPIILFNHRKPGDLDKAKAAGEEILTRCIEVGGSITGEHGVGMEKNELMAKLFSADTLETIRRFKLLFDPANRLNPGKVLPTGKGCIEIRQPALGTGSGMY